MHTGLKNIVAIGTVFLDSTPNQKIHGAELGDKCFRVRIDEPVQPTSVLPVSTPEFETVGDANRSFVAWPKQWVIFPSTTSEADPKTKKKKRKALDQLEDARLQHGYYIGIR